MPYLIAVFLLFASTAWADDAPSMQGTLMSISVSEDALLNNNEVVVDFRLEASGSPAAGLQDKVNVLAATVNAILDKQQGLRRQTTGRSLQMLNHYDKTSGQQKRDGWRLVQSERLITMNLSAVPDLIDQIEKAGAHLDRLAFRVSAATAEAALDNLRDKALKKFKARSSAMAKTMDAPTYRIVRLSTDADRPVRPMMQRGVMALSSAEQAPALNAGQSRLGVTVSGEILLPEKVYPVR